MQKLYSELIGMPITVEYSFSPVALVRDVIIDPETGKIVAFLAKKNSVIVPMDIIGFHSSIVIADTDHILPIDDVLRVRKVLNMRINILGAKVIAEKSKAYLGRVVDYEIDTVHMVLTKIHVAKLILFFRFQERIISQRQIIKIGRHKITVKDSNIVRAKEKAAVRPEALAA